ncbi:MAG: hypothetical protein KF678_04645 [Phycisphaeraceae bacterium]|nr:hypothetical protein [Phycisphaeraceae bacterium]
MAIRALLASVGLAASVASGQTYIMVVDSANDRVSLHSPIDGSVINPSFIANQPGLTFNTPKDAIQVGNEVWVSDQVNDAIYRFDLQGVLLGQIGGGTSGGLDNIRGMELINNVIYVSNGGTGNGAPGANHVVMFDPSGNNLGSFQAATSPFDIARLNATELLVTGSSNSPDVTRHDLAGVLQGTWHNGTISFAQQIARTQSGEFLIAGFTNARIHRFDAAGTELGVLPITTTSARGVIELDGGLILWTGGSSGINVFDPVTSTNTLVLATTGAQYANRLVIPQQTCYPNCDGSTGSPLLTANDFQCFLNKFAAGDTYANCDGSTGNPLLTANDFQCFLNKFAAGCS